MFHIPDCTTTWMWIYDLFENLNVFELGLLPRSVNYFTAEILNQLIPQKYLKEYSHQCIIWPLPTAYCSKLAIITHNQWWCGGGGGAWGIPPLKMLYFALLFCFLAIPVGSEDLFFPLLSSFKREMIFFFFLGGGGGSWPPLPHLKILAPPLHTITMTDPTRYILGIIAHRCIKATVEY